MAGPIQPLPPLVVAVAAVAAGVEAVLQLGAAGLLGGPQAIGWRLELARATGFFRPVFERMLTEGRPDWSAARLLSYWVVHASFLHVLFGTVLLLALGQAVGRRFGTRGLAVAMLAGLIGGALAHGFGPSGRGALIGVYPLVYGLIGAFTLGLLQKAGDRRARIAAFRLIGVLVAVQIVFRVGFGAGGADWLAEAGGFFAGFSAALFLGPEGAARLRRLRGG